MNLSGRSRCYDQSDRLGGFPLPTYRLYRLDGAGKISAADWMEAADDDDARQRAEQSGNGGSYEIWNRERLVIRVRQETR